MMAWYGTQTSQNPLERLLEKNPSKIELFFEQPDFIPQLKKFNSSLLEHITNNPDLVKQTIEYIIIPPKQTDSDIRKYKYPLISIEMIETEAVCVLNSFFKEANQPNHKYFIDYLFDILNQEQILVISAGYFFRVCQCLLNLKYKELIDYVYSHPEIFTKLLKHSSNISITNVIQLFLNLQASKADKIYDERKKVKVETVNLIIKKIDENRDNLENDTILNLCNILNEIIEKYYLLIDGKELLQPILNDSTISFWFSLIDHTNPQVSMPITNIITCLINYYSFSSLNNEDKLNEEFNRRNQERLESQPLLNHLNLNFERIIIKILSDTTFSLRDFKLLEMLCHCVSLSSYSLYTTMRKIKFFAILIDLLFKFENANILHNLIEKTFLHIFISQKRIYQVYKQHIFCELDIISRTVKPIINQNLSILKRKSNFGHLMKIIKIYSSIQTMNENIINSIKMYTDLWTKVSIEIIKPYEEISLKELGTYDLQINETPIEYKIKQISFIPTLKNLVIEDVDSEAKFFSSATTTTTVHTSTTSSSTQNPSETKTIMQSDNFFKLPTQQQQPHQSTPLKSQPKTNNNIIPEQIKIIPPLQQVITSTQQQPIVVSNNHPKKNLTIQISNNNNTQENINNNNNNNKQSKQPNRINNFNDFLEKKKVEASQTIKLQRSTSQEKKLAVNKGHKMASPSPRKRDKWADNSAQENTKQTKISLKKEKQKQKEPQKPMPIPPSKKLLVSQSVILTQKPKSEEQQLMTRSLMQLSDLKNVKVKFVTKKNDTVKKCRKVQQKDMPFLNFLGIVVTK